MLTSAQRKRLAKEARKLAMECVEGTAPKFGPFFERRRHEYGRFAGEVTRCCAIGELAARTNVSVGDIGTNGSKTAYLGSWEPERIVSEANGMPYVWREISKWQRQARLVFPLLALADALEEA